MDPLGMAPILEGMLRRFSEAEKRRILRREMLFTLIILLLFVALGNGIVGILGLDRATLTISGGIVLFMIALGMVFPGLSFMSSSVHDSDVPPFIVPIAVPLIAGPSIIAVILFRTAQAEGWGDYAFLTGALVTAWTASFIVLALAQRIMRRLGERGATALERLMGILLILMAVQMFINGLHQYSPSEARMESPPVEECVN